MVSVAYYGNIKYYKRKGLLSVPLEQDTLYDLQLIINLGLEIAVSVF